MNVFPKVRLDRGFHTSALRNHVIKLTRLRVVDNSEIGVKAMSEGKPPRVIHVYNKTGIGTIGDRVLCAIKGEKKHGIIVGCKKNQKPGIPRYDSNNVVLVDETGSPLGTRVFTPLPSILRTLLEKRGTKKGINYTKILSLATTFV